jgi:hypothetical protein
MDAGLVHIAFSYLVRDDRKMTPIPARTAISPSMRSLPPFSANANNTLRRSRPRRRAQPQGQGPTPSQRKPDAGRAGSTCVIPPPASATAARARSVTMPASASRRLDPRSPAGRRQSRHAGRRGHLGPVRPRRSLIRPPLCHDDEQAMIVLRRPGPAEISGGRCVHLPPGPPSGRPPGDPTLDIPCGRGRWNM